MQTKFNYVTLHIKVDKEIKLNKAIVNPTDAAEFFRNQIGDLDREAMGLLCLNTKNEPNSFHIISIGSINNSIVHPREVFKTAILSNANKIMIAHNHPSGTCEPSCADLKITATLLKSGDILGVELLDHIIVSTDESNFYSFRENQMLDVDLLQDVVEPQIGGINV